MKNIRLKVLMLLCISVAFLQAQPPQITSPSEVGMSNERLLLLDDFVQSKIDGQRIGGAVVLVSRKGKVVYHKAIGKADKNTGVDLKADDIFQIMSMTKPIVATATMQLYEQGKLQLRDPVAKYIPAFKDMKVASFDETGAMSTVPLKRNITVRDLLTHSSGIPYGFSLPPGAMQDMWNKFDYDGGYNNNEEFVEKIVELPLVHQPGERWTYGRSYGVLGRIIEIISGQSLEDYLEANIFNPLGMEDTGFDIPAEKTSRLVTCHVPDQETGELLAARDQQGYTGGEKTMFYGGGGLLSTAKDYQAFCQMILNGGELNGARILSRKTIEMMGSAHMDDYAPGLDFGLGFSIQDDPGQSMEAITEGSMYWGGLYNTFFWIDPKEELVGIILSQVYPFGYPDLETTYRVLVNGAIVD